MDNIHVVKRDGSRELFDANKINEAILKAAEGLPDPISMVVQVATAVHLTLFDGITSEQLDELVIQAALQYIKDDPDYDSIAARLLLKNLYKNILGDYDSDEELKRLHESKFRDYVEVNVADGLLDKRMNGTLFDLDRLAVALEPNRDRLSKYLGVVTNKNRYALCKNSGEPVEVPQYTHMRIAMGLSFNEKDPTASALDFYDHMSRLEYVPGGSTRINAGGAFPQLSNCFLFNVDDDMEAIAKGVRDTMFIAKGTDGSDTGSAAIDTITNDQVGVAATVPPSFTMSIANTTDNFTANLSSLGIGSTSGDTVTVNTNAPHGWYLWAYDTNTGLHSPTANSTISSTTPGTNATLTAGTAGYVTAIPTANIVQGSGSGGTTSATTAYASSGSGNGSGLNGTPAIIAQSTGTAHNATVEPLEYAAISNLTPAAPDYSDKITLIGAGSF